MQMSNEQLAIGTISSQTLTLNSSCWVTVVMSIDLSRPSSSCAGEDYDSLLEGENSDATPSRRGSLTHSTTGSCRLQRDRLGDENDDTEDQAQIDLVLNTNFDLEMFDYNWSDETSNNIPRMNTNSTCDNPSTDVCDDNGTLQNRREILLSTSVVNTNGMTSKTALHPQAIPSSADCPPIETSSISINGPAPENTNIESSLSQQRTVSTDGKNQYRSHDWTTNPSKSLSSLDTITATHTSSNVLNDSFLLSSQLQELIARQSAAPISNNTASSSTAAVSLPPFLLFDAPIELRANFIASQRTHGFPIINDNNTFHYQHPPQFSQQQMVMPDVHLVDGRHGGVRNKRVKNEREQKRTQKITDLIDQLRDKMEEGGWKVGGTKSKYATLSTCAEYVKHLVKATKEQELALEKTKQDLEAKRRKIDDDNEYQQDPSDPESTISSLTVPSVSAKLPLISTSFVEDSSKKRSMSSNCNTRLTNKSRGHLNESDSDLNEISCTSRTFKSKSYKPSDRNVSSEGNHHGSRTTERASNSSCSHTSGGASSAGAVARGLICRSPRVNHADIIVKSFKKRSMTVEATSMDSSFKLDYEEVFVKSSVPQLLATTAGRIVAWNDIFLKASGLLASDIDSVTIFSLVRHTELVKLFEIVAAALRSGKMLSEELENDKVSLSAAGSTITRTPENTTPTTNYTAITLPCATFRHRHASNNTHGEIEALEKLLYMTVTLMTDNDPKKRCFHCVFTDSPGTNGALGSVTPELLSMLFNSQRKVQTVDSSMANNV